MRRERTSAAPRVAQFLSGVVLRQRFRDAAWACLAGAAAGTAFSVTGVWVAALARAWILAGAAFLAFAVTLAWLSTRRTRFAAALLVERTVPGALNVIVTAEEIERHPDRVSPRSHALVLAAADRALTGRTADDIVRWTGTAVLCAAAVLVAAAGSVPAYPAVTTALRKALPTQRAGDATTREALRVRIEPPPYSGRPRSTMADPERIEALEGSRVVFELPAKGALRVRLGDEEPAAAFVVRRSGYFAVEDERSGAARLIPLTVVADHAPSVQIATPGKDLLLPAGARNIPLRVTATDDLALSALEVRFTKVSGSGEQFEFQEGSAPVTIDRRSEREWRGAAQLDLTALRLGPGDSLVYRAVARDRRSGDAALGSSDTYFVEISGPGQIALEGVEMPPDMERYALSQQMVVLKIERLRARQAGLAREALTEETAAIAAEQRSVKANFIFLLGGHVEDEEEEAAQSHEIQEGRLENTARRDINAAIGLMTRAEQGLTAVDTASALPPARLAVEALQRAFGRSRYLLRSLAVRSRLDPARRLTGELTGAADWRRDVSAPEDREGEAARAVMNRVLRLAAAPAGEVSQGDVHALAEAAMRVDPSSPVWQGVAAQLSSADAARPEQVRQVLSEVTPAIAAEARRGTLPRVLGPRESRVRRAWQAERQP